MPETIKGSVPACGLLAASHFRSNSAFQPWRGGHGTPHFASCSAVHEPAGVLLASISRGDGSVKLPAANCSSARFTFLAIFALPRCIFRREFARAVQVLIQTPKVSKKGLLPKGRLPKRRAFWFPATSHLNPHARMNWQCGQTVAGGSFLKGAAPDAGEPWRRFARAQVACSGTRVLSARAATAEHLDQSLRPGCAEAPSR